MTSRDYEEFIAGLNGHGVRYLLIGAHAVAFHARPRATKDLDILYWIPLRGTPAGPWMERSSEAHYPKVLVRSVTKLLFSRSFGTLPVQSVAVNSARVGLFGLRGNGPSA